MTVEERKSIDKFVEDLMYVENFLLRINGDFNRDFYEKERDAKILEWQRWLAEHHIDEEDARYRWGEVNLKRKFSDLTVDELKQFDKLNEILDGWRQESRLNRKIGYGLKSLIDMSLCYTDDTWEGVAKQYCKEFINKRLDLLRQFHVDEESVADFLNNNLIEDHEYNLFREECGAEIYWLDYIIEED